MPMIAVGENHTIALRSDGTVWSWGNNSYGQSGNGSKSSYTTIPVQVMKRENATASPSALDKRNQDSDRWKPQHGSYK